MYLLTAQRYAAHLVDWLKPYTTKIEIAGSVRRGLANCNDIDLVCIPQIVTEKDMLGAITSERNLLWEFLHDYVRSGKATFQSGGSQPGKFCILQLAKCQLDVYFAEEKNFASRFLCRTGSKEHNIWLATRAREQGLEWKPYEGLYRDGVLLAADTESWLYGLIGLGFIPPANREERWLKQNTGTEL